MRIILFLIIFILGFFGVGNYFHNSDAVSLPTTLLWEQTGCENISGTWDEATTTCTISDYTIYNLSRLTVSQDATLVVTGTLTVGNSELVNNVGSTIILDGGTIDSRGDIINNGIIENNNGFILQKMYGLLENSYAGTINNNGIITFDSSSMDNQENYGEINNFGTINIERRTYFLNGNTLNNEGIINIKKTLESSSPYFSTTPGSTFYNGIDGVLNIENRVSFWSEQGNDGIINILPSGEFNVGNTLNNNAGGTLNNDGLITIELSDEINNDGTINNRPTGEIILQQRDEIPYEGGIIPPYYSTINNNVEGDINNIGGTVFNNGTINNLGEIRNMCDGVFENPGIFTGNEIMTDECLEPDTSEDDTSQTESSDSDSSGGSSVILKPYKDPEIMEFLKKIHRMPPEKIGELPDLEVKQIDPRVIRELPRYLTLELKANQIDVLPKETLKTLEPKLIKKFASVEIAKLSPDTIKQLPTNTKKILSPNLDKIRAIQMQSSTVLQQGIPGHGPQFKTDITPKVFSPPLAQLSIGVSAEDVICNEDFVLLLKANDGKPICVKPGTAGSLIFRGWALTTD